MSKPSARMPHDYMDDGTGRWTCVHCGKLDPRWVCEHRHSRNCSCVEKADEDCELEFLSSNSTIFDPFNSEDEE